MGNSTEKHPFRYLAGAFLLFFIFLAAGFFAFFLSSSDGRAATASESGEGITVILDAGHGGEDGGAVGTNGILEKDLNLLVTSELAGLLRSAGVTVIETRVEDKLLYKEEEDIAGHRKEYDLKNRLAIARAHPDAIFVSIHMNTYSVSKYRGLQVYYANTAGSPALAYALQTAVKRDLQPENKRKPHATNDNIYLLENAVGKAVLVECGFLSNPEECASLSEKDYRTRLCFSLFYGMMEYIKTLEGENL